MSFDILGWFYFYWWFCKHSNLLTHYQIFVVFSAFFILILRFRGSVELVNFINAGSICSNGMITVIFCEGNKFSVILILTEFSAGCCKQFKWNWNLLCSHFCYCVIYIPLAQSPFIFRLITFVPSTDWIIDYFIFYFHLIAHKVLALNLRNFCSRGLQGTWN